MAILKNIRVNLAKAIGGSPLADVISYWQNPLDKLADNDLIKKNMGYVWRCITSRAENVARIEFQAVQKMADGTTQEAPKHPFLQVLNNPNPQASTFRLLELTQQALDAVGNAYWYYPIGAVTSKPKEIYWLDPRKMRPVVDVRFNNGEQNNFGLVTGYIYRKNDATEIPFDLEEVEHFMYANLDNPNIGVGVIEAGLQYIRTEGITTEFSKRALENNATPSGLLLIKNQTDKDAFEEFKQKWRQEYGNVRNTGKVAIIQGGEAEFVKMGISLGDVALKELKNMSRDDIMLMFSVSKPIIGITEDVNLANAKVAEYVFAKRVVEPLMHRITDALQDTMKRWGEQYELSFKSPVPLDMKEKVEWLKQATGGVGWMTPNEARNQFEELEDRPELNDVYIPINMLPVDAETADAAAEGEKSKSKIKVMLKKKVPSQKVKAVLKRKELSYEQKESFRQQLMATQERFEQVFKRKVAQFATTQKNELIERLPKEIKSINSKAFEEILFDEAAEAIKMHDKVIGITLTLSEEQGRLAAEFAGLEPDEFIMTDEVTQHIDDSISRMSSSYNQTTKAALATELQESLRLQESIGKVKKRISSVYSKATRERAELVARTETLKASNFAARSAYSQTGYIQKLEWFVNPNACEFCLPFKGKIIDINGDFAELGATVDGLGEDGKPTGNTYSLNYEKIAHPPLHPQCRCSVLPVFE